MHPLLGGAGACHTTDSCPSHSQLSRPTKSGHHISWNPTVEDTTTELVDKFLRRVTSMNVPSISYQQIWNVNVNQRSVNNTFTKMIIMVMERIDRTNRANESNDRSEAVRWSERATETLRRESATVFDARSVGSNDRHTLHHPRRNPKSRQLVRQPAAASSSQQ